MPRFLGGSSGQRNGCCCCHRRTRAYLSLAPAGSARKGRPRGEHAADACRDEERVNELFVGRSAKPSHFE